MRAPCDARRTDRVRYRGFTLIELILVIIIMGVLAAVVAPRLLNTSEFSARGFHDETMAILRYAQKTAIAQRRAVCVTVTPTQLTLTQFKGNPAPATCAAATLAQAPQIYGPPPTELPFSTQRAKGSTSLSTILPGPFQFTPLGSTDQTSLITISVANSTPIYVEATTGYVHD